MRHVSGRRSLVKWRVVLVNWLGVLMLALVTPPAVEAADAVAMLMSADDCCSDDCKQRSADCSEEGCRTCAICSHPSALPVPAVVPASSRPGDGVSIALELEELSSRDDRAPPFRPPTT